MAALRDEKKIKVCMVVPQGDVRGGIAAVVNGYRGSRLERDCAVRYVESYCDGGKGKKLRKALAAYRTFAALLRAERPDVVHIHSSFGPSFYRKLPFILMSARAGVPVVNHIHGAEFGPFYENASARKRALVRRVYGRCARFIVLSEEWREKIAQIVPRERIDVVENYSVPAVTEPTEQSRRSRQVLFLGEIGRRKGGFDLPDIALRIRERVPQARFVIAGDGERNAVEALFEEAGLAQAASFPGWLRGADKERALRESALFLLPSYNEGMPMAVLDAMGYALPVVSTEVGGIPQLVRDGQNGALRRPGDTAALAEAAADFLLDEKKREAAGMASLAIVRERFGLERHLDLLEETYRRAMKAAPRPVSAER